MTYRLIALVIALVAVGLVGGFAALAFLALIAIAMWFALLSLRKPAPPPHPHPRPVVARLRVWFTPASYIEGDNLVMRLTNEQKVKVTVAPKTAGGNPASIDGPVEFTSSDETVATIEVIDDTSAYVRAAVGANGAAQITATFDADLGDGVRTITASGALEVVPAEAETGEIVFGVAEQQ